MASTTTFRLPLQTDFREQIKSECSKRSKLYHTTIFGTAFSLSDEYLIGVSSDGQILVWDLDATASPSPSSTIGDTRLHDNSFISSKKRKTKENISSHRPMYQFQVCNGALYDVKIIPQNNGESSLIVVCGDEGIFLYEDFLHSLKHQDGNKYLVKPLLKSHLKPNAYLYGSRLPAEFNRVSYDSSSGRLFGAAGDGCGYIWDINTSQRVGSLQHKQSMMRSSSHTDYLHTIQVIEANSGAPCHGCVLTGGADGKLSMWSGKDQALIDTFDCMGMDMGSKSTTAENQKGSAQHRQKYWISTLDVDESGNWSVIGGGSSKKSARGTSSHNTTGGFLQLFNLHNRSIMTSTFHETMETIHDVTYTRGSNGILSVGNDGVVSSWPSLDFSEGRIGHAKGTSPASYSISVHPLNGMVATGNVGSSVDCFTEYLTRTCTLTR